jgi:hypothetical protein
MTKATLLQNLSPEDLTDLIGNVFDTKLKDFQTHQNTQTAKDELLSREQVLELLQINSSTLWHWQNKGKITVYKFANKCYYKRSELMESITPLKK